MNHDEFAKRLQNQNLGDRTVNREVAEMLRNTAPQRPKRPPAAKTVAIAAIAIAIITPTLLALQAALIMVAASILHNHVWPEIPPLSYTQSLWATTAWMLVGLPGWAGRTLRQNR